MPRYLQATTERFPVAGSFTISRGTRTHADVVTCTIRDGSFAGRGECVPYPRYGESIEGVVADIEAMAEQIAAGQTRQELQQVMKPGAARNAVDCALWDLEAKISGKSAAEQVLGQRQSRSSPLIRFRFPTRKQWPRRPRRMQAVRC